LLGEGRAFMFCSFILLLLPIKDNSLNFFSKPLLLPNYCCAQTASLKKSPSKEELLNKPTHAYLTA
jgi:hypothetical protein